MGKKRKAVSPLQASPSPAAASVLKDDPAEEIRVLREEICNLKTRLHQVEHKQDVAEQRNRLVCLIFSGSAIPDPVRGEDTADVIRNVVLHCMSITLNMSQIDAAFRLRSGNIMVQFKFAGLGSDRHRLYKSRTALRGTGLFINESLTQERQDIFRTLLRLKRERLIHTTFTQNGNLFVKESGESKPIKIINRAALNHLVETVSQPDQRRPQGGASGTPSRESDQPAPSQTGALPTPVTSAASRHPGGSAEHDRALVARDLDAPLQPTLSAGTQRGVPAPVAPSRDPRDLAAASAPAPEAPTGDPCDPSVARNKDKSARPPATCNSKPASLLSPKVRPLCKMRVNVAGRSRVISILNRTDVMETVTDMVTAEKQQSLSCFDDVKEFLDQLNRRECALWDMADGDGNIENDAVIVGQLHIEAGQLFRKLCDA